MTRNTLLVAMALSITLLSGCYASGVDRNWGRSTRIQYTAQIANPEAPESLEPTGLDPRTGEQAMEAHRQRSIDKVTATEPASVINIGSDLGDS